MRDDIVFSNSIVLDSKKYGTVDYSKFTIVKSTVYSSVMPYHFFQISKILKSMFISPKIIVDACAHIGGSTINIANTFPNAKLISVELKKRVCGILKKNVLAFGYQKRVITVNENCIPYLKKMTPNGPRPDFVNIDPPWGGPGYEKIKNFMLSLNNNSGRSVPIYDIINIIFARNLTSHVTFKAPNNFDITLFKNNTLGDIQIFPIYNRPKKMTSKKRMRRRTVYYYIVVSKRFYKY
jgi:16S rRNA G966 N2-methylase RsmD